MSPLEPDATVAALATVGAGLVTGILFAFSNFALQALAELPAAQGMFAMQRINARIQNPVFLALFIGTPLLCLLVAWRAITALDAPGALPLLLGAGLYVLGPFGITVACNVPLNDRLAATAPEAADVAWPAYRRSWQRWNHVRSALGIVAVALLATGLAAR